MSVKKDPPADPYAAATKHPMLASRLPMALEADRDHRVPRVRRADRPRLLGAGREQEFYVGQGQKRYQRTIELDATRGRIVDRNGAMLAVSLSTYEIWANPKQVADTDYPQISKLLDMPLVEVKRRLGNDKTFVLLKRQVDADTAGKLDKLAIDGVTQIADSKRFYPEGESAAHVVGFTNVEDKGQEGVEPRRMRDW